MSQQEEEKVANEEIETNVIKSNINYKRSNFLNWNDYFMATAILSSKRSKDPATQVGACIVDSQKRIVAVGYNGFPRGCSDDIFPWSKSKDIIEDKHKSIDIKNFYVVHAEANAILNSNSSNLDGTQLYTTLFPCHECAKLIIQSGIKNILYMREKNPQEPTYRASKRMFEAVGITFTKFIPTQKQIVIDFDTFA